jgi:hypothetical protein
MSKISLKQVARSVGTSLSKHSPEILVGFGIAGMVTTVVLAVKATPKALHLIEEKKEELEVDELTPVEVVKTTWKCYVPAAISGVASAAFIIGSNSVNAKRNAALATAYKLSETALTEYRDAVIETVGEKKEKTVQDKLAEKHVKDNPVKTSEIYVTGKGQTLCLDPLSHRYFYCSKDRIDRAINKLNFEINSSPFDNMGVTLNDFYEEIGLPCSATGDGLGWNLRTGLIEYHPGSQIVPEGEEHEGEPCLVIEFTNPPKYDGYL